MAELAEGYLCPVCGERHQPLPLSFSVPYPLAVLDARPEEVTERVVMNADQCVLDGRRFFLRGRIVVPVHGVEDPFVWGVWAEVSPRAFLRTQQQWRTPGREREAAFPGWLDTELPLYGSTLNLPVEVHTQPMGRRPHFRVIDEKHPLALEQQSGISLQRAGAIAGHLRHGTLAAGSAGR